MKTLRQEFEEENPDETVTIHAGGKWRYNTKYVGYLEKRVKELINRIEARPGDQEITDEEIKGISHLYIMAMGYNFKVAAVMQDTIRKAFEAGAQAYRGRLRVIRTEKKKAPDQGTKTGLK